MHPGLPGASSCHSSLPKLEASIMPDDYKASETSRQDTYATVVVLLHAVLLQAQQTAGGKTSFHQSINKAL